MKEMFLAVIRKGGYDLEAMLSRIDEYHIGGKLTDAERTELIAAARGEAAPGVEAAIEIQRLWAAMRELTARVAALEGGVTDGGADAGGIAAYRQPTGAHDAYYAGDLVTFDGEVYECAAPSGVACVWSPVVMPEYWQPRSNA